MKLIHGWKRAWRYFSIQAMALSGVLQGAWAGLPDDLKSSLPAWIVPATAIGILVLGILGRLIWQPDAGDV